MKKALRKKYRTFDSVDTLLEAQEEIKKEYRDLEKNAMSNIFDPVQIGLSVVPKVFGLFGGSKSTRKNKRALRQAEKASEQTVQEINSLLESTTLAPVPVKKQGLNIVHLSRNDSFGKKVFASFIRWQLVELGFWGVKKLLHSRK